MPKWPPDYAKEAIRRESLIMAFASLPNPREAFKEEYQEDPIAFINDWCWTTDPRAGGQKAKKRIVIKPFILYPKQREAVEWVMSCIDDEESGLTEKTRGAGATWAFCALSVFLWLFWDDVSIGWGSRKEMLVDRKGDMDSIFEKMRFTINKLPWFAKPEMLNPKIHLTFMKCENPANGAFIKGEAGDNIGRGGRSLVYFKDESAHYEHADSIEAALSENTNTQIDFSSVNGVGNVFHQNRFGGQSRIFIFDTSDVPWMTKDFLAKKKRELEAKGLGYKFAQEYERDYAASVEGILIPGAWIRAAVDAHLKLDYWPDGGRKMAALDPMDEGGDTHALCMREGQVVRRLEEWIEGDTDFATIETTRILSEEGYDTFLYDAVGVGSGVKASMKHTRTNINGIAYKGSFAVAFPDNMFAAGIRNKDIFKNLKAQSWWEVRLMFERVFKAIEKGEKYDPRMLISLDSRMPLLQRLIAELSQPTRSQPNGLIQIDKKPNGSKSPNLADALIMSYSDHLLKPVSEPNMRWM